MRAEAADRRAAIATLEGHPRQAIQELHTAIKEWTALQMPYEAAQSRLRLGDSHRAENNEAAALMEIESANATLERLAGAGR
jgi:hypothetical protein